MPLERAALEVLADHRRVRALDISAMARSPIWMTALVRRVVRAAHETSARTLERSSR